MPSSKIAYLPLIPESSTNTAFMKEAMLRLVRTAEALGDQWVLITGDQATYELARAVRDKDRLLFDKVILFLGGFHQAHNFLGAICKIIRGSGVENIIAEAGLCSEGTARKVFGERGHYYQTLHAIRILNEAVWQLFWQAFEDSANDSCKLRISFSCC